MKTHIPYIAAIIGLIVAFLLLRSCDKIDSKAENIVHTLKQREEEVYTRVAKYLKEIKKYQEEIAQLEKKIAVTKGERDQSIRETNRLKSLLVNEYPTAENCSDSLNICLKQSAIRDSIIYSQETTIRRDSVIISATEEKFESQKKITEAQSQIIRDQDGLIRDYKQGIDELFKMAKPRIQVFIAGNMATTGTSFLAGPEVLVQDKKGFLYGGFAQFSTDNRHVYGVKIGWRLQFKKRY